MKSARSDNPHWRRPLAVLLDRSVDLLAGSGLVHLEPDDRYHVTDCRLPPTARRLSRYDVLVIAGCGLGGYSRGRMDAIVRFVRRGGGLLLAGSAGAFERFMHRPVEEMAVAGLARRFGIEFLSPTQAAGRTQTELDLSKGYPSECLRVCRCPDMRGIRRQDVFLDRWSPMRCCGRATALLAHRTTGEPAAVSVRFGRGRVVAVGGTSVLRASHHLCRRLLEVLAAGRRRERAADLPWEVLAPYQTRRSGNVELRYAPALARRAEKVLRIARTIASRLGAACRPKKDRKWTIELTGGCGGGMEWRTGGPAPTIYLGTEAPDEELAFELGGSMLGALAWSTPAAQHLWQTVLDRPASSHFAGLEAMRWCGFGNAAEVLAPAMERESLRRLKGLDAGRYYGHGQDAPGLWIWRELSRRHGGDLLERFLKAVPNKWRSKLSQEAFFHHFTHLDLSVHFLSRAVKADLYPWFAALGATVRPLPLERFGSRAFDAKLQGNLLRRVGDHSICASDRADALAALVAFQGAGKGPRGQARAQLSSAEPARRLTAAVRLNRCGDGRALPVLNVLARRKHDQGLAAIAALELVSRRSRQAAGRLAQLAEKMDHRFQLDAGYQLARIGDRRAHRFSLKGIARADGPSAARLETRYRGQVQVFPTVDGQQAANVFSLDLIGHMPHNTHFTMFYVTWVHTDPRFRRKGLSRWAMERSLADPILRRCSCFALHTGTRNVAHALYRSFGLVDAPPRQVLTCQLEGTALPPRPSGIRVRPYRLGDEKVMARLFNGFAAATFAAPPARPRRPAPEDLTLLAFRGSRPVGYLTAGMQSDGNATIRALAVDRKRTGDQAARALVRALHQKLIGRGFKRVTHRFTPGAMEPLLQPLGYRSEKSGQVALIAVRDLPQFLGEIAPLLGRRLADTSWTGTIALRGQRLRAGLKVGRAGVRVLPGPLRRADVALEGSDETITRIVTGIETPYEAYLQLDIRIRPLLGEGCRDMLEKLFPRLEVLAWLW